MGLLYAPIRENNRYKVYTNMLHSTERLEHHWPGRKQRKKQTRSENGASRYDLATPQNSNKYSDHSVRSTNDRNTDDGVICIATAQYLA